MSDKTKKWIKAAGVRAAKTMAQTAVAMLPVAATITAVDWQTVAGTAALAGVVSILTSLAGLPELDGAA
ncbi:holin [Enterocloster lavalensis]|uniref:holin n=1 Tax=Enterocloster lavalensis TaxID=460384 RepID=UPI0023F3F1DB|nr:holin [Enterocloster lavalensis]